MSGKIAKLFITIAAAATILFFVFGCAHQSGSGGQVKQISDRLAIGPDANAVVVRGDYASKAIDATGGLQAWMQVTEEKRSCVVTFYKSDGTFYLTEQVHKIFPWSNSIRISAVEPGGKFFWQLSESRFIASGDSGWKYDLPAELKPDSFAEAILDIITAPVRFLDKSTEFTQRPGPMKIEGLFYRFIRKRMKTGQNMGAGERAIFCQNQQSSLVDIIWYGGADTDSFLAVRGYNYTRIKDDGILIPRNIEIYRADSDGVLQKRLVKIDYK